GLVEAAAGLALVATLASALRSAFGEGATSATVPAAVTFLVTASGLQLAGVGSAFWGLLVGIALAALLRPRTSAQRS
ncbi:benzoate/H(+) symporter BenE family transporter, partial [Actinotalea ferrariae]|uniref:benzoate/H(+) symporter BenE family transporter n=1 Tax=Actinotalea ferrariae TaxID=1386098 RepID=UPI001C8B87BA